MKSIGGWATESQCHLGYTWDSNDLKLLFDKISLESRGLILIIAVLSRNIHYFYKG